MSKNIYIVRDNNKYYIINNGKASKASANLRKVARKAFKVSAKSGKPVAYSHNGATVSAIF